MAFQNSFILFLALKVCFPFAPPQNESVDVSIFKGKFEADQSLDVTGDQTGQMTFRFGLDVIDSCFSNPDITVLKIFTSNLTLDKMAVDRKPGFSINGPKELTIVTFWKEGVFIVIDEFGELQVAGKLETAEWERVKGSKKTINLLTAFGWRDSKGLAMIDVVRNKTPHIHPGIPGVPRNLGDVLAYQGETLSLKYQKSTKVEFDFSPFYRLLNTIDREALKEEPLGW